MRGDATRITCDSTPHRTSRTLLCASSSTASSWKWVLECVSTLSFGLADLPPIRHSLATSHCNLQRQTPTLSRSPFAPRSFPFRSHSPLLSEPPPPPIRNANEKARSRLRRDGRRQTRLHMRRPQVDFAAMACLAASAPAGHCFAAMPAIAPKPGQAPNAARHGTLPRAMCGARTRDAPRDPIIISTVLQPRHDALVRLRAARSGRTADWRQGLAVRRRGRGRSVPCRPTRRLSTRDESARVRALDDSQFQRAAV